MNDKHKPAKAAPAKPAAAKPDAAKTVKLAKSPSGNKAVVTRKTRSPAITAAGGLPVLPIGERNRLVAETAYYIAERRGFTGSRDLSDWFEAEQQVDAAYRFT